MNPSSKWWYLVLAFILWMVALVVIEIAKTY